MQTIREFRIDRIDVDHLAMPFRIQFPLRFRKAENEKIVRDERIRETSRRIDEVVPVPLARIPLNGPAVGIAF